MYLKTMLVLHDLIYNCLGAVAVQYTLGVAEFLSSTGGIGNAGRISRSAWQDMNPKDSAESPGEFVFGNFCPTA